MLRRSRKTAHPRSPTGWYTLQMSVNFTCRALPRTILLARLVESLDQYIFGADMLKARLDVSNQTHKQFQSRCRSCAGCYSLDIIAKKRQISYIFTWPEEAILVASAVELSNQ